MQKLIEQFKADWRMILGQAVISAIVILLFASGLSALLGQNSLAKRVDDNAAVARQNVVIARAGVDSIVCILGIRPENRTDAKIKECMQDHGYLQYYSGPLKD